VKHTELRDRTKQFALRIVRMFSSLSRSNTAAQVMGRQALRSGTSVAANFREASRARSDAEFVAKLGTVEQELDETLLWLELLVDARFVTEKRMAALRQETDEFLAIIITIIRNMRKRR
jgi:four helix bundle protein